MKSRKRKYSLPIFIISIIIGLAYAYITSKPNNDISTIQQGISHKIIRFHVIANSDSDADQALKLKVKEAVVNYTSELLCNSKSIPYIIHGPEFRHTPRINVAYRERL